MSQPEPRLGIPAQADRPPRVCVVIPAKNEADSIGAVIAQIRDVLRDDRYGAIAILVVDDSVDQTADVVRSKGAMVVPGGGVGLGYAMSRGLRRAARLGAEYIVSVDGDGQADPGEIPRFLAELEAGRADLVLGSRFLRPGSVQYRYPWLNRLGVRMLVLLLWVFSGRRFTDSHGGIRAMRRRVVEHLAMTGTHSYVQETIIDAVQKGYRVIEISSVWRPRKFGRSRVVASIPKYAAHTLPVLIVKSGKHITWLASMGALFVFGAIVYFFAVLIQERFSVPALFGRLPALLLVALLVLVGTQLFFTGLVLEMLRQIGRHVDRIDAIVDDDEPKRR